MKNFFLIFEKVLAGKQLKIDEQKYLFAVAAADVVQVSYIRGGKVLYSEEGANKISPSIASALVAEYVGKARSLDESLHLQMFDLADAREIVLEYMRYYPLSDAAEMKLFDDVELLEEYIKYNGLGVPAEKKLFSSDLDKLQLDYIIHYPLSAEMREILLTTEGAEDYIRIELEKRRTFAPSTQEKMLEVANAHEWMKRYTQYGNLCEAAQIKLFQMAKPKKMVRLYESRKGLSSVPRAIAVEKGWL